VKLVLDEMWSPAIAEQLRVRGRDVIAAQEPEHHQRYGGISDELFVDHAHADGRAIVTDNIDDFEMIIADRERKGVDHAGVIFCARRQFDRSDQRIIGRMVEALDRFDTQAGVTTLSNLRHWLRPAD
jgi:hypothetical protein